MGEAFVYEVKGKKALLVATIRSSLRPLFLLENKRFVLGSITFTLTPFSGKFVLVFFFSIS